MIKYEIIHLDMLLLSVQVKYSLEGNPDFWHRMAVPSPVTDEGVHEQAQRGAVRAEKHWSTVRAAQEFTLANTKGEVKYSIQEPEPEYEPSTHKTVGTKTETDESIIYAWDVVPLSGEEKMASIRMRRDALLHATDLFAVTDRPVSEAMMTYRAALRDLPQQDGFPDNISWPVLPID